MEPLKVKIKKIVNKKKKLNVEKFYLHTIKKNDEDNLENEKEEIVGIKVVFNEPMDFKIGEKIRIEKESSDILLNKSENFFKDLKVLEIFNEKEILIEYPFRDILKIEKIYYPETEAELGKTEYKVVFSQPHRLFQEELWTADKNVPNETVKDVVPSSKLKLSTISFNKKESKNFYIYNKFLMARRAEAAIIYDMSYHPNEIYCESFNTNIVEGDYCQFNGSDYFYEKETEKYKEEGEEEEKERIVLGCINESVSLFKILKEILVPIELFSEENLNLQQEEKLFINYTTKIKDDFVPEYIDMEKVCFEPYYTHKKAGGEIDESKAIREIVIKPHFREREGSDWSLKENGLWYKNKYGVFSQNMSNEDSTSLIDLGFTKDDIYYQKNRLKQSFLRLSFFDTNNIFNRQLLFYSTIFFDTGKCFGTFLKNIKKREENDFKFLFPSDFSVHDRYNFKSSSEGFYIYLFPEILGNKYTETIYMTIEFNHAGFGKTIPLLWNENETIPNDYLKITNIGFENDMEKYFKDLFIPIEIRFLENINKFIYIFPSQAIKNKEQVVLNVFEPKMN